MKTAPRLKRLFTADGRCFDVALDHGFFNEHSMLQGIEDMHSTIPAIVAADADAIQLTPGLAPPLQAIPGKAKHALVLRRALRRRSTWPCRTQTARPFMWKSTTGAGITPAWYGAGLAIKRSSIPPKHVMARQAWMRRGWTWRSPR